MAGGWLACLSVFFSAYGNVVFIVQYHDQQFGADPSTLLDGTDKYDLAKRTTVDARGRPHKVHVTRVRSQGVIGGA